jgi:hypothetical protein
MSSLQGGSRGQCCSARSGAADETAVPCEECPLRAVHALREFSGRELEFVSGFKSGELKVEAGTSILLQSTNSAHLYTILSRGSINDEMQHSVEALTDVLLCVFPREKLWALYTDFPTLAFDVTWLAAREEQNLLNVGRRTAMERLAYLLLMLFDRASEIGLAKDNSIHFPFTQQHVADTLGMSLVHTNKILQRPAATRTMRWKDRRFELLDREGLARLAHYDATEARTRRPFI